MEFLNEASFLLLDNVRSRFALSIVNVHENCGSRRIFQSCKRFCGGEGYLRSIVLFERLPQPIFDSSGF